jgi:hypothetical protein
MSDAIESYELNGYTVEIHPEECASDWSPREGDNFTELILFGKARGLGDRHDYREQDHENWEQMEAAIMRDRPGGIIEPIYLMDHSGISISTSDGMFRACDSQGWDWGQVGFVTVSGEAIRQNFGVQRISKQRRQRAVEVLESEVETYNSYLMGDVYCYTVKNGAGEVVDCQGCIIGLEETRETANWSIGEGIAGAL